MRSLRLVARALLVVVLALTFVIVLASAAGAQVGAPSSDAPAIVNIFDTAQLIALVGGVIIPFVVALLARPQASGTVKALLAVLSAGLLALGTYLTDTNGSHTWKGALSVLVVALVIAAASRVSVTGHKVDEVLVGTKGVVG